MVHFIRFNKLLFLVSVVLVLSLPGMAGADMFQAKGTRAWPLVIEPGTTQIPSEWGQNFTVTDTYFDPVDPEQTSKTYLSSIQVFIRDDYLQNETTNSGSDFKMFAFIYSKPNGVAPIIATTTTTVSYKYGTGGDTDDLLRGDWVTFDFGRVDLDMGSAYSFGIKTEKSIWIIIDDTSNFDGNTAWYKNSPAYELNNGALKFGILSSVPEPASLLLLGAGLIGLAGLRRKMEA